MGWLNVFRQVARRCISRGLVSDKHTQELAAEIETYWRSDPKAENCTTRNLSL